jgi:hypothetical protein
MEKLNEHVDILEIDAVSYATAVAHVAADRFYIALANNVLSQDAPLLWFNGGFAVPDEQAEAALQALGSYCCAYHHTPGAEQLYRKAHELGLHALDPNGFHEQPLWLRVSYRVFAVATVAVFAEISDAQAHARDEEQLRRMASERAAPVPVEDTVMEQEAALDEKGFDEPPTPPPLSETQEPQLATGDASPAAVDKSAAAVPDAAAAQPVATKRKR